MAKTIEVPKPPKRGILVIADDLSDADAEALQNELERAGRENDWPLVLVGITGPVYWVGGIEDLPAELRTGRAVIHTPSRDLV